ncbi:MAG: hypothetical protein PHX72_00635 [Candidatus Shapirobacteria bacterium]|nr:hypothetical protein [Candidatus Shapirobacteria bacterium]
MKKVSFVYFAVFLIILLVSFYPVLKQLGVIVPSWDWNVPLYQEQFIDQLKIQFDVWEEKNSGGYFYQVRGELFYWLVIFPFSFLPVELIAKIFPVFLIIIAYWSMFFLAQRALKLKSFWSFGAAVLYALSPFVYSRLIAGHLTMILSYALIPLMITLISQPTKKNIFLLVILFPFLSVHLNMAVLVLIILFAFVLFLLIKQKKSITRLILILFGGLLLVTAYLWLPTVQNLFNNQPLFFKESSLISNFAQQEENIKQASINIASFVSFNLPQNLYTEFVYPFLWPKLGKLSAAGFSLLALAGLIWSRKEKSSWPFSFLFFFGLIFSTGVANPIGKVVFMLLAKINPLLSAGFDNPPRFLPIYLLGLISLVVSFLAKVDRKIPIDKKIYLKIAFCLGLFFLLSAWWSGGLAKSVYDNSYLTFSLASQPTATQNKPVYDSLKKEANGYRISYFPPTHVSPLVSNESLLRWQSQFPPQPHFLADIYPDLTKKIIAQAYLPYGSQKLNSLLAMASVKFLVWDNLGYFNSHYDFDFFGQTTNYQPIVYQNLNQFLKAASLGLENIYQIQEPYPMVYLPDKVIKTNQLSHSLVPLLENDFLNQKTAIIDQEEETMISSDLTAVYGNLPAPIQNPLQFNLAIEKPGQYQLFFKDSDQSWRQLADQELFLGDNQIEIYFKEQASQIGVWEDFDQNTRCANIKMGSNRQAYRLFGQYLFTGENAHLVVLRGSGREIFSQEDIIYDQKLVSTNYEQKMDFGFSLPETVESARICLFNPDNKNQLKINSFNLFSFYQPELLAVNLGSQEKSQPPQITFERIAPSQYRVVIVNASDPFLLTLNQSFHPGWQIIKEGKILPAKHFPTNSFTNTWEIQEPGNYQLTVKFAPQKIYRIGLIISGLTFFFALGFLVKEHFCFRKSKKSASSKKKP